MDATIVRPFNDFWLDCLFNSYFSLLTTIDKEYSNLSYLNCYVYVDKKGGPNGLSIANGCHLQKKVIFDVIKKYEISFKDKSDNDIVSFIIDQLQTSPLFIGVDLYYWVEKTICWKKYHWSHYSLIINYCHENDSFVVLDADSQKYDVFHIPRNQFIRAIRNCSNKPDGYTVRVSNVKSNFFLDPLNIKQNAERTSQSIMQHLSEDSIWDFSTEEIECGAYFDLYSMYAYQIMNRHIANSFLIKQMIRQKLINERNGLLILESLVTLKAGWEVVKNIFLKCNLDLPRKLDLTFLRAKKNNLLEQELKMWDYLID